MKIKEEQFRKKVESIYNLHLHKLEQIQLELKQKEMTQRKNKEKIKRDKEIETKARIPNTAEVIKKVLNRWEDYKVIKKNEIRRKQVSHERLRKKYEEERGLKFLQQKMAREEKEKQIIENMKKNDEIIQKRI